MAKDSEKYVINPDEWEMINDTPVYTDENLEFCIICEIHGDMFKLLGESLTLCGDSDYYLRITDGLAVAHHYIFGHISDYMNEENEFIEPIILSSEFIARVKWLKEYDDDSYSMAYEFLDYISDEPWKDDNDHLIYYATHFCDMKGYSSNWFDIEELLEYYYRIK